MTKQKETVVPTWVTSAVEDLKARRELEGGMKGELDAMKEQHSKFKKENDAIEKSIEIYIPKPVEPAKDENQAEIEVNDESSDK